MLHQARARGFSPQYVIFDSWYGSLENLKLLQEFDWRWLTRLKSNRSVDPGFQGRIPVETLDIPLEGAT